MFLSIWWTFWTFGGLAAFGAVLHGSWGDRSFLVVWLCGWAAGECFVAVMIAWMLCGRELLIVTPERLEVRKEVWRFARTKNYDAALVRDIEAAVCPTDEDERPRKDFCLKLSYEDDQVRVGEGMDAREAEYVASTVLGRIRPRTPWDGEREAAPVFEPSIQPERPEKERISFWRSGLFPLIVIAFLVMIALNTFRNDADQPPVASQPSVSTTPAQALPPMPAEYARPVDYASAKTMYALRSSRTQVLGTPRCGAAATWTRWSCVVMARPSLPPFAGRTMLYRCKGLGSGTLCGPARQPPVDG